MPSNHRRTINDDRYRRFGGRDPQRLIAFVCECGEEGCQRAVTLAAGDYRRARRAGAILHGVHERAGTLPTSP